MFTIPPPTLKILYFPELSPEDLVYECFYLLTIFTLPLVAFFTLLAILTAPSKLSRMDQAQLFVSPVILVLGSVDAIAWFVLSDSLGSLSESLDYLGWMVRVDAWFGLALVAVVFYNLPILDGSHPPALEKTILLTPVLITIIWLVLRLMVGTNDVALFILSLSLIVVVVSVFTFVFRFFTSSLTSHIPHFTSLVISFLVMTRIGYAVLTDELFHSPLLGISLLRNFQVLLVLATIFCLVIRLKETIGKKSS